MAFEVDDIHEIITGIPTTSPAKSILRTVVGRKTRKRKAKNSKFSSERRL
jgi:hypothetical protein